MIDGYITFLQKDSQYMRAIKDYHVNESTLLAFHKGDIIKVRDHEVIKDNKGISQNGKFQKNFIFESLIQFMVFMNGVYCVVL